MGQPLRLSLQDEAATERLGADIAGVLQSGRPDRCLILLKGELGTGKTTLARGLLKALGHEGAVPSPTYTLVEPYELESGILYHLDLYRLGESDELEYLGWRDMAEGTMLIEWPERAPQLGEHADLEILLEHEGCGRRARLIAMSPLGERLVARLMQSKSHFK